MKAHAAQLGRFLVVGLSAVGVDFLVYFAITGFVPFVATSIAKAASFIAGAVLAFALNRGFVFRSGGEAKRQLAPFAMLYLMSLLLNNGVNAALLGWGATRFIAWFIATGASTVSNFVGMKFVVFRERRAEA